MGLKWNGKAIKSGSPKATNVEDDGGPTAEDLSHAPGEEADEAVQNCRKNWAGEWPIYDKIKPADFDRWELHCGSCDLAVFSDPVERARRVFEDWHFDTDNLIGPAEATDYAIRLIGVLRESGLEVVISQTTN
jgi:hypothetical protein